MPDAKFVSLLYNSILDRPPTDMEIGYRIEQLNGGRTRFIMISKVIFSKEAREVENKKVGGVIIPTLILLAKQLTLIENFLKPYTPLHHGRSRRLSLFDYSKLSDRAFIAEAYKTFLHRRAAEHEIHCRLLELEKGRTRIWLLIRVALSYESRRGRKPKTRGIILPLLVFLSRTIKLFASSEPRLRKK
jgi:hypothetical protein